MKTYTRHRSVAWPMRILMATTIATCVALAATAQPVETPVPKTERIGEIEELVKKGQLGMTDAVKMAERHSKGVAFKARCTVKPGPFSAATGDSDEQRLMYEIVCVLNDEPVVVKIDGLKKKVLTPPKPETPPAPKQGPAPQPKVELPVGE